MGELLHFDLLTRRLDTMPPERRIDELLASPDAQERVQALEPFKLYTLIAEAGPRAHALVHLASPAQCQACADLACWTKDNVDVWRLEQWLLLFLSDSDEERTRERLAGLDTELLGVYLRQRTRWFHWQDEADAKEIESLDENIESSPDGTLAIVVPRDPDQASALRLFLFRLFSADLEAANRLLDAARWDTETTLEETAYQMRRARLEELGFLPFDQSGRIYARVDVAKALEAAQQGTPIEIVEEAHSVTGASSAADLPAVIARELLAGTGKAGSLLGQSLVRASQGEEAATHLDGLLTQLSTLVRMVVMADLAEPGDLGALAAAYKRVDELSSLGLEFLSERNPARAASLLVDWPIRRIFSVGYNLTRSLGLQAHKLIERGNLTLVNELPRSLCTQSESELVEGLSQNRPMRSAQAGFATLSQVEDAAATLALLAYKELWAFGLRGLTRAQIAQAVIGPPGSWTGIEQVTFDTLLATDAALSTLEESPSPTVRWRALNSDELRSLWRDHLRGGASELLLDRLREAALRSHVASDQAAARRPHAERWALGVGARLAEEYEGLSPEALDEPRYLSSLVLVAR